jgi:hypothetical protein
MFNLIVHKQFVLGSMSYVQEKIWLDEQINFGKKENVLGVYNLLFSYNVILSDDVKEHEFLSRVDSSIRLLIKKIFIIAYLFI